MNPDQPSREQIEARITALLLGELPADEAALLRYTIAQDPALQKLHDELQSALPLVREAAKHPADAPMEKPAPLKLSADRREKLLAHFKTPRPQVPKEPLFWLKRIEVPRLIMVLALVAVTALLAAMLLPALSKAKHKSMRLETLQTFSLSSRGTYGLEDESKTIASPLPSTVNPAHGIDEGYQPISAPPTAIAPVTVNLAPEPKLAPPPAAIPTTQIVLPQPESTPQIAAQTPRTAESDNGGVYSQHIVGYVNVPLGSQALTVAAAPATDSTPPALPPGSSIETTAGQLTLNDGSGTHTVDTQQRLEHVERQWIVPSQANEANTASTPPAKEDSWSIGGGGGFGGVAAGGAYGGPIAGNRNEALADTEKSRQVDASNSGTLAWDDSGVNRSLAENQPAGLPPALETPPQGSFSETESLKTENQTLADRKYYRTRAQQSEITENKSLPAAAPVQPAFENSTFASPPPPAQMPAPVTTSAPVVANTFSESPAPAAVTADHGLHVNGLATGAASDAPKTSPATGEPSWVGTLNNADIPHGPNNQFVTRYPYTGKTPVVLDQAIQSTNYIAINNDGNFTFNPGVSAIAPQVTYDLTPQDKLGVPASDSETLSANQAKSQSKEEMVGKGEIDFQGIDLSQALDIYAKLADRTVLRGSLPQAQIILNPQTPLTKTEAMQALQAVLALNGISLVNVGDKFVEVLPSDQASTAGGEIDRSGSTNVPAPGRYVTQVVQLKYVKPTEMIQIIQPFTRLTNSILPIDNDGVLVLRDEPTNVMRMLKMIQQVDVSVPDEYISEVIPIRHAKVDDIADALNELGNTKIQLAGQMKIIANEKGNSLLVYATRPDMVTIKGAIEKLDTEKTDLPLRKPTSDTPLPQPEILTSSNAFSTFSLNVSDVSFKLAEASLENSKLPDTASIRSEEFINAFDYRDPEAAPGQPMAFTSERAAYPFAHNRDLLRFSIKTAAAGRQEGRPLNLVLLLDTSGSMERADRVEIIHEALRVLSTQLHQNDVVSVVSFARTARLWADGVSGDKAGETLDKVGSITPEGGTNLEEAMRLAYETAHRHYLANGINRVVLLTDGAANLGNVDPNALEQKVDAQRKQGIALDCFGIGWEDFNDDLLEDLSSNGDGRYAFLNSPEDAAKDFGTKLAGALQVAAQDVKVQVEFNPQRVISYRQIGYAKHQLTKQQFRDNTVAAGEIAAQEAGNALYTIETNPNGDGPIATVHVRYRIPGTQDYHEHSWDVAYTGNAPALDQSSPAMRLAATASAFSEWLAASPYAQEVTPDALAKYLSGVPEVYGADDRPKQLETMIREARSLEGK